MNTPQLGDSIQTQILDHYENYGSSEQYKTVADLRREISAEIRADFSDIVRAEQEISDILDSLDILHALGDEIDDIEHRAPDADVSARERRMDDLWDDIWASLKALVKLTESNRPKVAA